MNKLTSILLATTVAACASTRPPEPHSNRIDVDLASVNADGLRGPPSGLRAVHYEFCMPADERHAAQVRGIDPTAQPMRGSRGRIGCTAEQVLVVGSTHQPGYRQVLERLAALPYVEGIAEAHFE